MDISALQIPKSKQDQFRKKGINTIEDLVNFLPRKYYDFTQPKRINYMERDEVDCTLVKIKFVSKGPKALRFLCEDDAGTNIAILFMHQDYLQNMFVPGDYVLVGGVLKVDEHNTSNKTMFNPMMFSKDIEKDKHIKPIYSQIKGMTNDYIEKCMMKAIGLMPKEDFLEPELLAKYQLWPYAYALKKLHFPANLLEVDKAKERILFNDLFLFNYHMKEMTTEAMDTSTHVVIKDLSHAKYLISTLPYPLTASNGNPNISGQKDVLNDITIKMMQGIRVNALLQGDVGCGKTLVALLLMTIVSGNGYQSCIVAPTNILAKQHYAEIKEKAEALGFKVGFLSSELSVKEQNAAIKAINEGEYNMVVGTHSLMSDKVNFYNLGLAIVDEEHRFGVEQREKLSLPGVHKVSMSATPIPRSLAMSMYGDLIQVETINVLPAGRQELHTEIVLPSKNNEIYFAILEELEKGRQAYIVCPLKTESDSDKLEDVVDVKEEYEAAVTYFSKHGYKVGMVTGATKASDNAENVKTLAAFKNHEFDVLVATTIIEVGVNVPNASIILIKNAERFGFAQLHQLRGRVGRGNAESYCYLMTNNKAKFSIFAQTRDGFKIAEEDLKLRGAGSFLGTEQSGDNKYLMLIMANKDLNEVIKSDVDAIYADPARKSRYYNLMGVKEVSEPDEDEQSAYKKYRKKPSND
jgi:ATP-dependent DNA helicase RecG